ncbi:hypothetical protein JCGZ_06048 [Jatropha curcas]|uniref:Glycine-rich protein n=1 Tax=Jatropha curcas TaxID=180498 RepID=A0A067KLH8_JATCU|nr:hypothetical protein JCGZ_06048 [Jatropha curcas]
MAKMASYATSIIFLILFASYNTAIARTTRVPKAMVVADENKENLRVTGESKTGVGDRGSSGGGPGGGG